MVLDDEFLWDQIQHDIDKVLPDIYSGFWALVADATKSENDADN